MSKSGAPGWGRMAASRFAKSEEEIKADILKAIEGKLSVEFQDYSQWQRDSEPVLLSPQPSTRTSVKAKTTTLSTATASRPLTGTSGTTACSSLCLHPWNKKAPPVDRTAETINRKKIILLQAQVQARKKSIQAYKDLKNKIQNLNFDLQSDITSEEGKTHKHVTQLLEKYEKCSSAAKVLTRRHKGEVERAQEDLEVSTQIAITETQELSDEVARLDHELHHMLLDLQVLRTYKDKEYPVKEMTITKLQNNVHSLEQENKNGLNELERIIRGEHNQLLANRDHRTLAILQDAADAVYYGSGSSLLEKVAQNNHILRHEIAQNQKGNLDTWQEIQKIKRDINELSKLDETNVRKYVFPEVQPPLSKCQPDDDVILDIPKQEVLPI